MNKREMLDQRTRQDMAASKSDSYKAQKEAHDKIETRQINGNIPLSDEDYFEQLWKEVNAA